MGKSSTMRTLWSVTSAKYDGWCTRTYDRCTSMYGLMRIGWAVCGTPNLLICLRHFHIKAQLLYRHQWSNPVRHRQSWIHRRMHQLGLVWRQCSPNCLKSWHYLFWWDLLWCLLFLLALVHWWSWWSSGEEKRRCFPQANTKSGNPFKLFDIDYYLANIINVFKAHIFPWFDLSILKWTCGIAPFPLGNHCEIFETTVTFLAGSTVLYTTLIRSIGHHRSSTEGRDCASIKRRIAKRTTWFFKFHFPTPTRSYLIWRIQQWRNWKAWIWKNGSMKWSPLRKYRQQITKRCEARFNHFNGILLLSCRPKSAHSVRVIDAGLFGICHQVLGIDVSFYHRISGNWMLSGSDAEIWSPIRRHLQKVQSRSCKN